MVLLREASHLLERSWIGRGVIYENRWADRRTKDGDSGSVDTFCFGIKIEIYF